MRTTETIFFFQVAPLRIRPQDILDYQGYFARLIARRHGQERLSLTADAIRHLESYNFPDNVQVCSLMISVQDQ